MKKILSSALILGMLTGIVYAKGNQYQYGKQQNSQEKQQVESYIQTLPKQQLSQEEINSLIHMRQEEKLARDVYLTLYNKWHLQIFKNIANSEEWHMQMVKFLLDKYNLPDPVEEIKDEIGKFKDPKLTELYNKLATQGEKSEKDALTVGATIEDLDIKDLEDGIKETDNEDIKFVYQKLKEGSENHLRAFMRQLRNNGWNYTPQYISQEEFEQILNNDSIKNHQSLGDYKTTLNIYLSTLPKGWNMVGVPTEVNLSDINVNYKIIWVYKDGQWMGYSNNHSLKELIKNKYKLIETLKPFEAFWIEIQ